MQNDLISRSALKKTFESAGFGDNSLIESVLAAGVYAAIDNAPTIEAAPVAHGRWEKSDIPHEKYCCSACGGACWYYDYEGEVARSRYCPNCGAKMRGKTDEE